MLSGDVHPSRLRTTLWESLCGQYASPIRRRVARPLRFQSVRTVQDAVLAAARGLDGVHLPWRAPGSVDVCGPAVDEAARRTARIVRDTPLPVLVDVGALAGDGSGTGDVVAGFEQAGAAGIHIDDRSVPGADDLARCIGAATAARGDEHFMIGVRVLSPPSGSLVDLVDRAQVCVDAGADLILVEEPDTTAEYMAFRAALDVPLVADTSSLTGTSPSPSLTRLAHVGMDAVIHPITGPGTR